MRENFQISDNRHYLIPYENGMMSAYRFTPENPKGIFIVFGSLDSYVEEMFKTILLQLELRIGHGSQPCLIPCLLCLRLDNREATAWRYFLYG